MLKLVTSLVIVTVIELVWVDAGDFSCYPNQTIHFSNPNPGLYIHHRAFYDDGGLMNCTCTPYNSHADIYFDCGSTTATVTAFFSSRTLSEDDILGGQSISYTFSCTTISSYNATFSDNLNVSVNETAESATADYDITAAFYDGTDTEITEAALGDRIFFVIKAPAEFTLLPKTCTATGEYSESATLATNGCSNDVGLIGDFNYSTVGLNIEYSASFFVFKFYNSDTVTVECLVKVCPGTGNCSADSCTSTDRRRAISGNIQDDVDTKISTVGKRLRIVDRSLGRSINIKADAFNLEESKTIYQGNG